jgi:uncharacterized damage-inducible protein DinB
MRQQDHGFSGSDAGASGVLFEACGGPSNAQIRLQFDIGHGSVFATTAHMVGAIDFWSTQIEGRSQQIGNAQDFALEELMEIEQQVQATFAAAARKARVEERLDVLFPDVHGHSQAIGGTILHLVYHNVIHRSEVQHMLQRMGVDFGLDRDHQEWEYSMRERDLHSRSEKFAHR